VREFTNSRGAGGGASVKEPFAHRATGSAASLEGGDASSGSRRMSMTKKKPVTYDDLYDLPENRVGEILEGELYSSPRPSGRHSISTLALGNELFGPFHQGRN